MSKLEKNLCHWTFRFMMSNCTLIFNKSSFKLSVCFPNIAQSTRTIQHVNDGIVPRNLNVFPVEG